MSIKSGRYIITHAQHWNLAFLSDPNDGTSLLACLEQDVSGEEWNVKELRNGRYSIVNFGHRMSASAVFQAQKGEHVVGRERGSIWLIREHDSGGKYTIASANDKLRWWLDDSLPETPITLHDAPPSDPRCHWTFQKIGRMNTMPYDAAIEEATAIRAELARKTSELEGVRGELEKAKVAAVENAARRQEAESKASSKAAEVEVTKREAAQAKAEAATRKAEMEEAQRRELQLNVDLLNNSVQLQIEEAKAVATEDLARREEAELQASRKVEEMEEAKLEVAQAKAVVVEDAARREEEEVTASRKAAEVENAQREAAQAKDEVEKHKSSLRSYFRMASRLYQYAEITTYGYQKLRPNQAALFWAAENGDDVAVPLILEQKDVGVNSQNLLGWRPLSLAAINGHDAVVRVLLAQQGVDVNYKETYGRTPLYLGVQAGHNAVVRLLLGKEGVDVNARCNQGKTPLMLAEEKNHKAIAQLLREKIALMGNTTRSEPI